MELFQAKQTQKKTKDKEEEEKKIEIHSDGQIV